MIAKRMVWGLMLGLAMCCGTTSTEAAEIDLSLNLSFNDPSDFGSGGTWTVVGKADDDGIAGLDMDFLAGTLNFDVNTGYLISSDVFEVQRSSAEFDPPFFGIDLEIVVGDDLDDITFDVGVPGGSFPSSYVDDPDLTPLFGNPELGSFTGGVELVTGTFDPGTIPVWNDAAGNVFQGSSAFIANVDTTVRAVIPEPVSLVLFALSATTLGFVRRRN